MTRKTNSAAMAATAPPGDAQPDTQQPAPTNDGESGCIDPYDTDERADGWAVIETRTRRTVTIMGHIQEKLTREVAFDLVMWLNLSEMDETDKTFKQVLGGK